MTSPQSDAAPFAAAPIAFSANQLSAETGMRPGASRLIMESWHRSKDALGLPDHVTGVPVIPEDELDDSLLDMLHAPMTNFAQSLEGSGVGLLLADTEGRILDRWAGTSYGLEHLDRVGTVRGAVLSEETVGTNGVGTVIATQRMIQVVTDDHYSEFYRTAVCTGAPLFHPITGELLGAVTLSCDAKPQTELLQTLIRTLTKSLEQHMMTIEQPGTRQMLDEFLRLTRRLNEPVIGFGAQGLLVQNAKAGQFNPLDFQLIRQAAADADSRGRASGITSVGRVELKIERFPGSGNLLVKVSQAPRRLIADSISEIQPPPPLIGKSNEWRDAIKQIARARTTSRHVLVVGEAGSGKTSLAIGTPYRSGHAAGQSTVMDAGTIPLIGMHRWFERLEQHLGSTPHVVIRNLGTDPRTVEAVRAFFATHPGSGKVTFTAATTERESRTLALSLGAHLVTVPPLREHPHDIAALWTYFVQAETYGSTLTLSPESLRSLQRYSWPGNLSELHTLAAEIGSYRASGTVQVEDLPDSIRNPRTAGLIEQAEEDAIRRALLEAGGNRVRAAEILGVSRATVYRKMKSYRLA